MMSTSCNIPNCTIHSQQTLSSARHISQFHCWVLPSNCIDFCSSEGKKVFWEALQAGYMEAYFGLAAQFRMQDEPAFCGLSTLVMALNTLEVDPLRLSKGHRRWYRESTLDCCVPLEIASAKGITIDEFACVAACNTLSVNMVRADDKATEDSFRSIVKQVNQASDEVLVLNYSREVLGQTGDGHFSPVGGYHSERDLVLILDTARFKYPPHWVSLPLIFEAMKSCDKDTGLPRGYVQLRHSDTVSLVLFCWTDTLRLFLLEADQVLQDKTGITQFTKVWEEWLIQHSCTVEEDRVLEVAIDVLVKALAMLKEGVTVLTTQVDICCPETMSSEHCCVVNKLLVSLESMPVFRAVSEYLLWNSESSELTQNAQKHVVFQTKCETGQSSSISHLKQKADGIEDSVYQVEVKLAHFITIILLCWPEVKRDNVVENTMQKAVQEQLCCTNPILHNEVTQLKHQLSMLLQHRKKYMH